MTITYSEYAFTAGTPSAYVVARRWPGQSGGGEFSSACKCKSRGFGLFSSAAASVHGHTVSGRIVRLGQFIYVFEFCQIVFSRLSRTPMDHIMSAGIGVIRKIQMLDFELNSEFISERLHPILRCPKSIDSTVCDVCDYAISTAMQLALQCLIMPTCCKLWRVSESSCVKIVEWYFCAPLKECGLS